MPLHVYMVPVLLAGAYDAGTIEGPLLLCHTCIPHLASGIGAWLGSVSLRIPNGSSLRCSYTVLRGGLLNVFIPGIPTWYVLRLSIPLLSLEVATPEGISNESTLPSICKEIPLKSGSSWDSASPSCDSLNTSRTIHAWCKQSLPDR